MKFRILTPDFSRDVLIPSAIFQMYFVLFQADYFCEENVT